MMMVFQSRKRGDNALATARQDNGTNVPLAIKRNGKDDIATIDGGGGDDDRVQNRHRDVSQRRLFTKRWQMQVKKYCLALAWMLRTSPPPLTVLPPDMPNNGVMGCKQNTKQKCKKRKERKKENIFLKQQKKPASRRTETKQKNWKMAWNTQIDTRHGLNNVPQYRIPIPFRSAMT